jgi:hypothetical protein
MQAKTNAELSRELLRDVPLCDAPGGPYPKEQHSWKVWDEQGIVAEGKIYDSEVPLELEDLPPIIMVDKVQRYAACDNCGVILEVLLEDLDLIRMNEYGK